MYNSRIISNKRGNANQGNYISYLRYIAPISRTGYTFIDDKDENNIAFLIICSAESRYNSTFNSLALVKR